MNILVLNRGSSTIKCDLYRFESVSQHPILPLWSASLEWKDKTEKMILTLKKEGLVSQTIAMKYKSPEKVLHSLLATLTHKETGVLSSLEEIDVIGHRVVLGGKDFHSSVFVNDRVKEQIKKLSSLAPLHNPAQLKGIEILEKLFPKVPQVIVFDTAFHHTIPKEATIYPIPYEYFLQGIQRFGFHGISFQYCLKRAIQLLGECVRKQKIVICHLGSGASLCAIKNEKSIDTTMGFTPLEGLMMDTRSGSIDPGVLLYLLKTKSTTPNKLSHMLYHTSGLLGISGSSCDMRDILKQKSKGDEKSFIAFEVYIHTLNKQIGSMIASLEGIDLLIFTAGIGENVAELRERVCSVFSFLGLHLDEKINKETHQEDCLLSTENSKVKVLLIHTKESFEISSECFSLMQQMDCPSQ